MKLTKIISTSIFTPKKSRSVSRSKTDPHSFSSQTTSSSDDISVKKQAGLSTPTSVLPADVKQAFDRDGDGKIRREELEALLSGLGADHPRLMVAEVDRDGDGCVTLEEFLAIGPAFEPAACDAELRETFGFFDADRDGRITAEELFGVFRTIGDAGCTLEECRRMLREVDRNGDGVVCFEDFRLMMDSQLQT